MGRAVGVGGGRWRCMGVGPGAPVKCAHQYVTTDYIVQLAVVRLCYHRERI